MERITQSFSEALEKNGFQKTTQYNKYLNNLSSALSSKTVLLPSTIPDNELTRFTKMFFFKGNDVYKSITYISPSIDLWLRKDINVLKKLISDKMAEKGIGPEHYHFTGANFLTGELKELIIKNLRSSMGLAVFCIVAILFLFYLAL